MESLPQKYLDFIDSCRFKSPTVSERHHIVPVYAGGSNRPENLISLSPKDHAKAHKILWNEFGHWVDGLSLYLVQCRFKMKSSLSREQVKWVYRQRSVSSWRNACRVGALKRWANYRQAKNAK